MRQVRACGGDGRAVAVATPVARCEHWTDPRYPGRRRTQHRHADRDAVDVPQHESVADLGRGVDESLARRLVALAERFVEEELHPFDELRAVAVSGESCCADDAWGVQRAKPI